MINTEAVRAGESADYYKTGDVGVFCVEVQLPEDIAADKMVFSVRAEDEKIYLLNVQWPQSANQRLSKARSSGPLGSTPEQEPEAQEVQLQLNELHRKRGELSGQIRRARSKREGLIVLREEMAGQEDSDKSLQQQVEVQVSQAEDTIAKREKEMRELNEQIRALRRQQEQIRGRRSELFDTVLREVKAGPRKVFGRFQGSGSARLTVFARDSRELAAELTPVATVELDLPSAEGGNPDLLKQWAAGQARKYMVRVLDSPYTSYYQYWLLQAAEKYGISRSYLRLPGQGQERQERSPDLYAMTTGALAIQESLQLEEMTGRRDVSSERNVPITVLKGPDIKSHPFDKMIEGRRPEVFPIASLVPYDNYYCHFTSISKEIAASDLIKQWGTSLLRSITVTARDSDCPTRYSDQLCIDVSALTRLFGDMVIGEIAITGGDPFLREGTDLALVIEVKSGKVFETMMKGHARRALSGNADAKASESEYAGVSISSIVTPDRRISSHSAYLGSYKVYSNSMDTLRLIIDTYGKRRKSMAENLDLQYMRTIFPGTAEAEDGFIYLSDSFIRKLLSPKWKIEGQRRIICQTHLRMIANAATMYRQEMRKGASVKTLIDAQYLSEKATRCPDGGSYSLDESGRAFCTVHNCLQYCTPIASVPIDRAAQSEADDYKEFVRRYNDFWSRFFDPIGIRLRLGHSVEVETCILPLIENSMYNQLREVIGGEPVALKSRLLTERTVVSVAGKLSLDRDTLGGIYRRWEFVSLGLPRMEECLGDSVSLNFYDSDVLFTFAEEGMGLFGGWMGLEEQIVVGLIASAINLPIYAVLELKDDEQTKTLIRGMLGGIRRRAAQDRGQMFRGFSVETYSAGEYKGHEIETVALRLFVVKFRLHYAIVSGRLIVSTKRYALEKALDSLAKLQARGGSEPLANLQLNIRPRAVDKLRPIVKMGWQERMREACLKNIEPVRILVECHGATEQTLNETSRKVEGVTLRCPSGGAYEHDSERDIVYCSVHGNHNHPRQPVEVKDNEGLPAFIDRMKDFSVDFRFTSEGIMTKVAFELEPAGE
jgi:hypothetical protein